MCTAVSQEFRPIGSTREPLGIGPCWARETMANSQSKILLEKDEEQHYEVLLFMRRMPENKT